MFNNCTSCCFQPWYLRSNKLPSFTQRPNLVLLDLFRPDTLLRCILYPVHIFMAFNSVRSWALEFQPNQRSQYNWGGNFGSHFYRFSKKIFFSEKSVKYTFFWMLSPNWIKRGSSLPGQGVPTHYLRTGMALLASCLSTIKRLLLSDSYNTKLDWRQPQTNQVFSPLPRTLLLSNQSY